MKPSCAVTTAYTIHGTCTEDPSSHPHQWLRPADHRATTCNPVSSQGQYSGAPRAESTVRDEATMAREISRLPVTAPVILAVSTWAFAVSHGTRSHVGSIAATVVT